MERLREEHNGRLVVIDNDMFFADGVRYPLSSIWGVKGVFYEVSGSVGSAVVEGIGTVASSAAGCILGPIFGLCILGIAIVIFGSLLAGEDIRMDFIFVLGGIAFVCFLVVRGISSGTGAVAKAAAKKTYYLVIVTQNGEEKLLEGFPLDALDCITKALREVLGKDIRSSKENSGPDKPEVATF